MSQWCNSLCRGILPALDLFSYNTMLGVSSCHQAAIAIVNFRLHYCLISTVQDHDFTFYESYSLESLLHFNLQILYFIGFAFFCCESLVSIWVIQVHLSLSSPYLSDSYLTLSPSRNNIVVFARIRFLISLIDLSFFFFGFAASIYVFPRQW